MNKYFSKIFDWLLGLPLCVFLVLGAAFYNGYPLVYSDSGTYISSGFEGKIPFDRPIVYGEFIRFTSLGFSLWLTVLAQSIVLVWLMWRVWMLFFPNIGMRKFQISLLLLCFLTALPWYAGQLMPDIFTPMLLLIICLMLLSKKFSKMEYVLLFFLFELSCLVHFSNLFIAIFTLLGIGLLLFARKRSGVFLPSFKKRIVALSLWSAAAFFILPAINWTIEGKFQLSKGGYAFILGRMIDNGILKAYLAENCEKNEFKLCAYKDSLPESSRKFHWDANSPMHREGGWGTQEAEYRQIFLGSICSPKFLAKHFWQASVGTASQLFQNTIGSGLDYKWYRSPESPPYQAVAQYFPNELNAYRFSRQNGNLWKQELNFDFLNSVNFWVLFFTVLVFFYLKTAQNGAEFVIFEQICLLLICGIFANAFVTANLAVICDRFPSRVIWLFSWVVGAWLVEFSPRLRNPISPISPPQP